MKNLLRISPRVLVPTLFLVLASIVQSASVASAQTDAPQRPNIVVMLVDDMGVMDTSLPFMTDENGKPKRYPLNDYYRTPNMERLARQGIRFNNFCAMSVCSPTRISIQTGQNAARHRTTNWINPDKDNAGPQGAPQWNWKGLNKQSLTLARLLQQSGYRTIHVGKGHFGPRGSEGSDPTNIGFDINVGGASIGQPASYYGMENYGNAGGKVKKSAPAAVPGLEAYHGTDTFLTDALTLKPSGMSVRPSLRRSHSFCTFHSTPYTHPSTPIRDSRATTAKPTSPNQLKHLPLSSKAWISRLVMCSIISSRWA